MAIPLYGTAVTVGSGLRPKLSWAQGLTGVLRADRRHLSPVWKPGAPVAAAGAAGNVNVGAHRWRIVFVAAGLDYLAGQPSEPLTIATSAKAVGLTAVPLGPAGTTARKVFRTEAVGSIYKLVGTIGNNTATAFTDDVSDASLTDTVDLGAKLGTAAKSAPVRVLRIAGRYVTVTLPIGSVS